MSDEPIRIKRYPNRRFYATHTSRYISLPEIEHLIRDGATVEIIDSQTGKDITRAVLVQIIADHHPEKIAMFPTAMLHSMLRANDVMAQFLHEYFRNSLRYLDYLHQQGASATLEQPMHWMKTWLDSWPELQTAKGAPEPEEESGGDEESDFAERIARLEARIAELEAARTKRRRRS